MPELADLAETGSMHRRAATCAGGALGSTSSLTAARRCLEDDLDDAEVGRAARAVLADADTTASVSKEWPEEHFQAAAAGVDGTDSVAAPDALR